MTSHAPLIAVLEPLTRADCWDHLASGRVGRIGLLVNGRPEVFPVNYALDGETVLFRTTATSVLNQASLAVVAFEADYVDETTHTGWSVLVQGVARDIGDAIDATSERLRRLALVTWAPDRRDRWYHIDPDQVSGRRLRITSDAL
jgi:uncharacterized protein